MAEIINKITRIATAEGKYARDMQIYVGEVVSKDDEIWDSDSWHDVKFNSLFVGVYTGYAEDEIRSKAALDLGVSPAVVTLYLPKSN